jgi:hypothetical protein
MSSNKQISTNNSRTFVTQEPSSTTNQKIKKKKIKSTDYLPKVLVSNQMKKYC